MHAPTCIQVLNAIMKDNPHVCLHINDDLVRRFIRMAAKERAPRFLRFLRNMTGPEKMPIIRNQMYAIKRPEPPGRSTLT